MYISRKAWSVEVLLIGAVLCVGGCTSSSKPQLSVTTQAEALSQFSLGLLAVGGNDSDGAFNHLQKAIQLDPDSEKLYPPAIALALDLDRQVDAVRLAKNLVKHHPDAVEHQLLLAKAYTLTENPELAESLLRKLQMDFPENPDVPVFLTQICLAQKRRTEAIKILRTAVAAQGDNHELLLLLGALYIDSARTMDAEPRGKKAVQEGILFLQQALKLAPENSTGWQQLGLAFLSIKQPDEALIALQEARKYSPSDMPLARQVLDLLVQTGKYDEAISACDRLATETQTELWFQYLERILPEKEFVRLIQYLEIQINLPQPPVPYYVELGSLYLQTDQPQKAETVLLKSLEAYPADDRLQLLLGSLRLNQERYDEAYTEFDRARTEMPESEWSNNPFFLYNFLLAAQNSGHTESAARILAATHTNYPSVLNQYVRSLLMNPTSGSIKNGIELLTAFHEQCPDVEEPLYYLMMLQAEQKDYAKALKTAGQVETLLMKKNNTNLLNGTFYYQYASLYERTGQPAPAEKLFFKVIESGEMPIAAAAQNYVAYMWAERGEKLDMALTLIQAALKEDPKNGAFLDTLGWVYYMQGRYDEALNELKKACAVIGNDPAVLEHLGDTCLKLGRTAAAVEQWKKALKVAPESPRLKERLKIHKLVD